MFRPMNVLLPKLSQNEVESSLKDPEFFMSCFKYWLIRFACRPSGKSMNITFDSFIQPQIKGITFRIPDPEYRMFKKFYGSRIPDIGYWKNFSDPGSRISDLSNKIHANNKSFRIQMWYSRLIRIIIRVTCFYHFTS